MALKNLLVFVYGTLKREQPNHFWLTKPDNGYAKFIGTGCTLEKYPLVIATKYNIPFLLPVPGTGNIVSGEVFEVDDKMLARLDILEEHPNYYERRLELIHLEATNDKAECWTYFLKDYNKDLLCLKMYSNYNTAGEHGLPYWEKTDRDSTYDYKTPVKSLK